MPALKMAGAAREAVRLTYIAPEAAAEDERTKGSECSTLNTEERGRKKPCTGWRVGVEEEEKEEEDVGGSKERCGRWKMRSG